MLISQEGDKYMKKLKRSIAFILTLCVILTLLPPAQIADAAEVIQRYELDTDGIDAGATYLIVNAGTAGDGNALRFHYNNAWDRDLRNQSLTIKKEDGVTFIETGFTNEADCRFQFTGANAGRVTHGDYSLDLDNSRYESGNSGAALSFTNLENGQYRIHYTTSGWWNTTTYYLRYSNFDWSGSETTASVYLFKLMDHVVGYDVTFDGNGYTAGTLPENATNRSSGDTYTVPKPPVELRKDVGEDTWLFMSWNTAPDGSGTEYAPGETITITEDITLYAGWYQQTKYSVSMLTYLDNELMDVESIAGYDRHFFALLQGGDGTYIPLTKRETGVYSAKVEENSTYIIYTQTADGEYEPVHGHTVVIYGQNGSTECMHYSVTYNANGGIWAEGEAPSAEKHHFNEPVTAYDKIPTLEGDRFLGWKDQDGNLYAPGQQITSSIDKKITLTAQWEELITVTVNVVIDHTAASGGLDRDKTMHDVIFTLLQEENGANLPVAEKILTSGYTYDAEKDTTTYQVVFQNMPQGIYHVASTKTNYEDTTVHQGGANEDQTITIDLKYTPENFDLVFDVVVNAENNIEKNLMPQAVNVKVTYWGYDENGVLGWQVITQQEGNHAPTTITIDKNGKGRGFFPVWRYWSGSQNSYEYRLEVTSFIMPDGSVVPASGNQVIYTANGSGLYQATVSIAEGGGRVPCYPDGSNTTLPGAYFTGDIQSGVPTVTVDINPLTVTFDAGDGLINGQQTIILTGQYRYPDLQNYIAVPNASDRVLVCWTDASGNPVTNMTGQLLAGNVIYHARYSENITLSGSVSADASYQQDGKTVYIHDIDRAETVWVVLQKKVGDRYNDIDAVSVELSYEKNAAGQYTVGRGRYEFKDLPNDGTEYRVHLLVRNYTGIYDNNQDNNYTEGESVAKIDAINAKSQVDIHLDFTPDDYQQAIHVDASQIHKDLRPTGVLAQILYRDLGDIHNYQVISQHTVAPFGVMVELNSADAAGLNFYNVWNWHTNGAPYEYQAQISMVYGRNVPGAYSEEGLAYTTSSPFTVVYGPANNYLQQDLAGGVMLEAKLIPKQYPVHLDLNLGNDPATPVVGMEDFMVDDASGTDRYAFLHTWSYAEQFTAYPYREGYVFKGWKGVDPNGNYIGDVYTADGIHVQGGVVHLGNTLAKEITLVAQWEKLEGTDYAVRYLELNTDKVLKGATMVSGSALGSTVAAADLAAPLEGYVYVGALVNGRYVDKSDNPYMTVTNDSTKNLIILFYLPDGSDGYTEQVESNLEINKTAILENNGTYTIMLDAYTKDNPITTLIQQNTPLDIVLVLDQSGSLAENDFEYLKALQDAVENFVKSVADHGRQNNVDHRIAVVGYAGNATDGHSSDPVKATGGKKSDSWINTGVFDSNGEYHLYDVKGFNYTKLTDPDTIKADGIYYIKVTSNGETKYLLLTHYNEYRHLITEEEARTAVLQGELVYGYVYNEQNVGGFVELTRNSSGLWLYGNKQLYSDDKFFTYHTDVWTYRDGLSLRQIYAYGVGAAFTPVEGYADVYTREETTGNDFEHSIYADALAPVSVGAAGSGGTNPSLLKAIDSLGADGATRASYGMEMANKILKATPVSDGEGRVRLVVMFTDGEPGYMGFDASSGQQYYDQAVTEANNAINQAYIAKNTYGAYVYAIGLYESAGVEATSEVAYYMNALSSNYPNAKSMDDIKAAVTYIQAPDGTKLESNGKFFVRYSNTYYEVQYGYVRVSGSYRNQYCWFYKRGNTNYSISTTTYPVVSNGTVDGTVIYQRTGGYAATDHSGYYATTESADQLREYFEDILRDITTKITTEIVLKSDTILRDIMNQGLVLTDGTVITVYTQEGNFDLDSQTINWAIDANGNPILEQKVSLTIGSDQIRAKDTKSGVEILVYNLDAANSTDPTKADYAPHMVDITGYDFHNWFISAKHTKGYKMIVTITRVEAMDDVQWGRSTATNHERSGLWLPADENGHRELLLPFDQPTTIFVERAYVLDYGKDFTLSGWYFDDEDGKNATPIHVDCNIENGMNWFDPADPNTTNAVNGVYGNTRYGNVMVKDGKVIYTPTTMNWGGYDQFYVFGNTWRKTVLAQDANENGNLWNKVTVIPANNIYYEDSFVTTEGTVQNGIDGFTFTGIWEVVSGENAGQNVENPEQNESKPNGAVHGWTDSLADDQTFTDNSAHGTGLKGEMGASAEFTFTGTGVDIYTRTNLRSGMVVAVLSRIEDGKTQLVKSIAVDNLAASGDYYHIPTVSFRGLVYGTYSVTLIATAASTATGAMRYEYYIDGIRVYNPLGSTTNYQGEIIKDAYGLETNAVFTEIRDVLLDYGDFNTGMPDDTEGKMGAVFIDWVQPDQEGEGDRPGQELPGVTGQPTYNVGTFELYGPKNEVYLTAGQAIVLHVEKGNTYYVGLKSLTGAEVTANLSGLTQADPTQITLAHTTDLYYQVTPVDGYIVIQNGNTDGAILSITNLRTTNLTVPAPNGGILDLTATEAVTLVEKFSAHMRALPEKEPEEPEEEIILPDPQQQAQANQALVNALFTAVRQWLEVNEGEVSA